MQTRHDEHDERASLALATTLGERAKSLVRRPPVADERLAQASPGGSPLSTLDVERMWQRGVLTLHELRARTTREQRAEILQRRVPNGVRVGAYLPGSDGVYVKRTFPSAFHPGRHVLVLGAEWSDFECFVEPDQIGWAIVEAEGVDPVIDYDGSRFYPDAEPDECFASLTAGPAHDPYSTHCDLKPGHYPATPHEADCPFGTDRRVEWRGGGSCAGDPLPERDVRWLA